MASEIENDKRVEFEYLWRNEFIHIPPLDQMPREQYEQLKEFAWRVFWTASPKARKY